MNLFVEREIRPEPVCVYRLANPAKNRGQVSIIGWKWLNRDLTPFIHAAAKVLESSGPLNCKELIEAMATQGLSTSPGGKTPKLYSTGSG